MRKGLQKSKWIKVAVEETFFGDHNVGDIIIILLINYDKIVTNYMLFNYYCYDMCDFIY